MNFTKYLNDDTLKLEFLKYPIEQVGECLWKTKIGYDADLKKILKMHIAVYGTQNMCKNIGPEFSEYAGSFENWQIIGGDSLPQLALRNVSMARCFTTYDFDSPEQLPFGCKWNNKCLDILKDNIDFGFINDLYNFLKNEFPENTGNMTEDYIEFSNEKYMYKNGDNIYQNILVKLFEFPVNYMQLYLNKFSNICKRTALNEVKTKEHYDELRKYFKYETFPFEALTNLDFCKHVVKPGEYIYIEPSQVESASDECLKHIFRQYVKPIDIEENSEKIARCRPRCVLKSDNIVTIGIFLDEGYTENNGYIFPPEEKSSWFSFW